MNLLVLVAASAVSAYATITAALRLHSEILLLLIGRASLRIAHGATAVLYRVDSSQVTTVVERAVAALVLQALILLLI